MNLGDPISPDSQTVSAGILARMFKALSQHGYVDPLYAPESEPFILSPFSSSPLTGHLFTTQNASNALAIEGGFGMNTANAESYFGKKGTMLRRRVRIDKCPWPDGQTDIRLRVTVLYASSFGPDGILPTSEQFGPTIFYWNRNTVYSFGCGPVNFTIQAFGVGPGQPSVITDINPYTQSFVTLDTTTGLEGTYWYTPHTRHHMLPCPQWSAHQINFPGDASGFYETAGNFVGAIGVVYSVGYEVEAVGWDSGYDDDASWHAGTDADPYVDVNGTPEIPNSFEYPRDVYKRQ